jgi:hypothetical protein
MTTSPPVRAGGVFLKESPHACCDEVTPVGETNNQDRCMGRFMERRLTDNHLKLMVAFR